MGYTRSDICERDTNKLEWKKAKELVGEEFFRNLANYNAYGPKENEFKAYERIKFLERNIEGIEPEQVDEYSIALGKLYRWL